MRFRLAVIGAALILIAFFRAGSLPTHAQPAADALVRVDSQLTYDIRPADGPVHITWHVSLQNNDPSTAYSTFGVSYYYSDLGLPIYRGATSVGATGPGGDALYVSIDESGEDVIVTADITFGQAIFYGDTYSFTLSYDIPSARSDMVLVTPAYVFLPVLAHGDSAAVTINTPQDADWDVTVQDADTDSCTKTGNAYQCSAPDNLVVPAVVEVVQPGALQNLKSSIDAPSGPIELTVQFFPGEEPWAQHVQEITAAALPVLEDLFGVPYDGARTLTIAESGQQDTSGYEGLFRCPVVNCEIDISPVASDHTTVHELAHLWTQPYEARWIAEGLAEFMSRRAGDQLRPLIGTELEQDLELSDFQLDNWPSPTYLLDAGAEEVRRELSGYRESLRFFETLEERIGIEAVQQANAAAAEQGDVDSQDYFDMLEDASGANLDELFLAEIFPPSQAQVLEQRRAVRAQLETLRQRSEARGLDAPKAIEDYVDDWRFDSAADAIADAQAALDAIDEARERIDASRNPLQRIGLLGKDPGSRLAAAEQSFRAGDFDEAERRAGDAADLIDGATRAALVRLGIALGALAFVVFVLGGSAWIYVQRRRRRVAAA